jgi:hypothetical protein
MWYPLHRGEEPSVVLNNWCETGDFLLVFDAGHELIVRIFLEGNEDAEVLSMWLMIGYDQSGHMARFILCTNGATMSNLEPQVVQRTAGGYRRLKEVFGVQEEIYAS